MKPNTAGLIVHHHGRLIITCTILCNTALQSTGCYGNRCKITYVWL